MGTAGGDPSKAEIFPDYAVPGASLVRPGFEAMMRAVTEKRIGVIVTEDISRISRDFADAAMIFKRLQFLDRGPEPAQGDPPQVHARQPHGARHQSQAVELPALGLACSFATSAARP